MKPPRFDYVAPRALDEALAALAANGEQAKVLAGGQSLIPLLNFRLAQPAMVVDINRIAPLAEIRASDGGVSIGALARQHAVERSELVRQRAPLVAEACRLIGHAPIRHRGTVGGSVAHGDPAAELPATVVALEAELAVAREGGTRTVAAERFFVGPLATALAPGEMLVEVRVPALPPGTGSAFAEVARRAGDFALVGAAAVITLDAGRRCTRARITLCGAGPTPLRARAAEDALVDQTIPGSAVEEAARLGAAAVSPPSDLHASSDFRRRLARHVIRQAVEAAAARAGGH